MHRGAFLTPETLKITFALASAVALSSGLISKLCTLLLYNRLATCPQ